MCRLGSLRDINIFDCTPLIRYRSPSCEVLVFSRSKLGSSDSRQRILIPTDTDDCPAAEILMKATGCPKLNVIWVFLIAIKCIVPQGSCDAFIIVADEQGELVFSSGPELPKTPRCPELDPASPINVTAGSETVLDIKFNSNYTGISVLVECISPNAPGSIDFCVKRPEAQERRPGIYTFNLTAGTCW